jgi:hypothetical protein
MADSAERYRWNYAAEKFGSARHILTRSFANNSQRMLFAMMPILRLHERDFPDLDIWERTKKLKYEATKYGPVMVGDTVVVGSLENSLRRRRRSTFERMADEIVAIDNEIRHRRQEPES